MNDEIKINKANKSLTFINNGIALSQFGIADEILDLITNLQQENERLKDIVVEKDNQIKEMILQKTNYTAVNILEMKLEDYKSRCKKAIEYNKEIVNNYLEEDNCEYCDGRYATAKHNLNILQNGSDEE